MTAEVLLPDAPQPKSLVRIRKFVAAYCQKSGLTTGPDPQGTETVITGLASNLEQLGKPLCPCRFYPDKRAEVQHRTWICACDDMQIYKYCHCLLFVTPEGLPVTEYLPEDHEGRQIYGLVRDPTPEQGRPLRDNAAAREVERRQRPS
jgi:ferredoxin-thioredoxin reductase catalytic chain